MFTYTTKGTCSRAISFEVDSQGCLHNVVFHGGCRGNTQGISKLVEGMPMDEVAKRTAGILCRGNTSCPDQLSKAIEAYKNSL